MILQMVYSMIDLISFYFIDPRGSKNTKNLIVSDVDENSDIA